MSVSVTVGAALVLSHLAAIPALVYLGARKCVIETVILAITVLISTLYHFCQVGWACFAVDLHAWQIGDHFMVFFALIWFLLYAAGSSERVRTAVSIAVMGVSLPVIISHIDTWFAGIAVTSLAVLAFAITFVVYARLRKKVRVEWRAFAVALALIVAGVSVHVFAGDFGPDNTVYPVAHTVWHVLAFVSLYYIAMIPFVRTSVLVGDGFARLNAYNAALRQALRPSDKGQNCDSSRAVLTLSAMPAAPPVPVPPLARSILPPRQPVALSTPAHPIGTQGTYLTLDGDPSVLNYYAEDRGNIRQDKKRVQ